jgi:two-component system osmolarity sensor histidine kinase EnvZ
MRLDDARNQDEGGTGLGLAIARENARLLGGDVEVWSEEGVGARFTLRLPVT